MQMPVFLTLFFAPVYVPLALLTGWIETVATLNPLTYVLEAVRSMLAGDEVHVALAFGIALALVGGFSLLGAARPALGGGRRLGPARRAHCDDRRCSAPSAARPGACRASASGLRTRAPSPCASRRGARARRGRRRLVGRRGSRRAGRRLPLRPRRRRRVAGPVLALAAGGRARPLAHPRHERVRDRRPGRGCALDELVLYELHVGTFSPEGTFDGVLPRLAGLRELGVTAIELMPVATFPGNRGWGYDGLYPFAPHPAYGGPDGLARLVDAAHREGLGVVLDVVYNHIGPGNEALSAFGAVLHRPVRRDAVGRGARLRAGRRARVGDPERGALGARVRDRRAAPRRRPRGRGRLRPRTSSPSSPSGCVPRARARS